jgi:hypothetical protein
MKTYLSSLLILSVFSLLSCEKSNDSANGSNEEISEIPGNDTKVPDDLISPTEYWTWGTVSSINFHDPYSTEYRNAGGVSVFFKFQKNGTYKSLIYVNASSQNHRDQTWTEVEGNFTIGEIKLSDGNIYKTFRLFPIKGTDKILTNTINRTTSISKQELLTRGNLSATFAFSRYTTNNKAFLDILNIKTNEITSLHQEY